MAHYHCSIKSGSRSAGKSASVKSDYITRQGKYEDRDDLAFIESGNMPAWAAEPSDYWKAADKNERANGTLYHEIEFALPNEVSLADARKLAQLITEQMTTTEDAAKLPFTMAIHDKEGNRHCHLMISGRKNDLTNDRTPETWFKRAPIGAEKVDLYDKSFLQEARLTVEVLTNRLYEVRNMEQRVDSRSYKDQGISQVPQLHMGPAALRYESQTGKKSKRRLRSEHQSRSKDQAPEVTRKINPRLFAVRQDMLEQVRDQSHNQLAKDKGQGFTR